MASVMKELMHKKEVFLGFELSPVCSIISMLSEFLIFFVSAVF